MPPGECSAVETRAWEPCQSCVKCRQQAFMLQNFAG